MLQRKIAGGRVLRWRRVRGSLIGHDNFRDGRRCLSCRLVSRAGRLLRVIRKQVGIHVVVDSGSDSSSELLEVTGDTVGDEAEEVVHCNVKGFCDGLGEGHVDGEGRIFEVIHQGPVAEEFGVRGEGGIRGLGFKMEPSSRSMKSREGCLEGTIFVT